MNYCSCGFDIGDPRVSRHSPTCAARKVEELQARIKELEADYHDERIRADKLFDECQRLRDDIQAHKDAFFHEDAAHEDKTLWALLGSEG